MRVEGVNFPKTLLDAQKSGGLLIFAGAGVSIPPPSNYPDFPSLAAEVASGLIQPEGPDEPIDRFLGRLAHQKVDVHTRVKDRLSDPKSAPNELHFDLLRLFPDASHVRLVTTNFDVHFSAAAREVFPTDTVEVFAAPALPVGSHFHGLVYLHGSVYGPADRLVLTDSDFGRAYLTEGWARRFLQQLFSTYVTLFVGYSHRDPVMRYLARGLPPEQGESRRFVLTKAGDTQWWDYLGIIPLEYQLSTESNKHSQLMRAVSRWSAIARSGALQRQEQIKAIVERPVPLDLDELDYIENALAEVSTLRFFTEFARRLDWLHWIENRPAFKRLFNTEIKPTEADQQLAVWFAREFACKHPDAALGVIRRKNGIITPLLWRAIAWSFHAEKVGPTVLNKWVPLLLKYSPAPDDDLPQYILHRSQFPEFSTCALLLFEYLTRPDVILRERFWPEAEERDDGVDVDLSTAGDDPWLPGVWKNFFEPNLAVLIDKIIWILTSHLQTAHLLLDAYGKVHEHWDSFSAARGQIESSAQGSPPKGLGILIDIARDVVLWSSQHRNSVAEFLIAMWFTSDVRILRRLAIFAVSKNEHWDSDAKLRWLLVNNLLYASGFKHEVFLVLENAFGSASSKTRQEVLEAAASGPKTSSEETNAYEHFNLVYWLSKAAPHCSITQAAFAELLKKYPEFETREHPDMDSWVGPVTSGWQSPLPAEQILSKTPEELLTYVTNYEPSPDETLRGESLEGLSRQVTAAVTQNFDWSIQLAQVVVTRRLAASPVWPAVVEGWAASVKGEQWSQILELVNSHEELLGPALYALASLLRDGLEKPDRAIPEDSMGASIQLGEKLWKECVALREARREDAKDWLFQAINNPAGSITSFFLHALSAQRKKADKDWSGIPTRYKNIFEGIAGGGEYADELGRVVLAAQLMFLFSIDEQWAVQVMVPLFTWSADARRALQCWHGFLIWGRWNDSLLSHLLPCYEEAFPHLHAAFGEFRTHFCSHLAGIALLSSINPLEQGWLFRFMRAVESEEREMWAASVHQLLRTATEASKPGIWNRWMSIYWRDRIQGVPVSLNASELRSMVHWAIRLEPVFDEAVQRVVESPRPNLEQHTLVYHELAESDLGSQHSAPTVTLLLHLLRAQTGPFWGCQDVEAIVGKIMTTTPWDKKRLLSICDELAHLGCGGAANLKGRIEAE